jgi:hypothetical protein
VGTIAKLISQVESGNVTHVYHGFGWPNIVCLIIGVAVLYDGYTSKEFRGSRSGEPIPVWKGRQISLIIGVIAILLGLFGRNWHY